MPAPIAATLLPIFASGVLRVAAPSLGMRIIHKVGHLYRAQHKFTEKFGPVGYGLMYASGTVLGYQGTSQFFKPKWKYLGSPQRVAKL